MTVHGWPLYASTLSQRQDGCPGGADDAMQLPGGLYEVTKRLPHNGREFEYRIKSVNEPHERVAGESELTRD
jgi:hypothetical protein